MYKRKSFSVIFAGMMILCSVIVIALAYAAFTGQLTINGTAVGRDSAWDIHFENVSNITTSGTAKVLNNHQPTINSNNPTQIQDYEVSLTSPSDSISFTFDVVNNGNYNAIISSVSIGTPECTSTDATSATNMCNNLTYTMTYSSGATINQNSDIVYAKDKITMKVTLTFNDINDASLLPTAGVSISNLGITINFAQEGNANVNETTGEVANNKVYHQGYQFSLNGDNYHIIADSGAGQDYVVALKDTSLTIEEINMYGGVGTDENHVNVCVDYSYGTSREMGVYGGVAYCKNFSEGLTNVYDESDIKYVVDTWVNAAFINNKVKEVNGYSARLITIEEWRSLDNTYIWKYNHDGWYGYWTMSIDIKGYVFGIRNDETTMASNDNRCTIRPVVNVYKSAIETNNNE